MATSDAVNVSILDTISSNPQVDRAYVVSSLWASQDHKTSKGSINFQIGQTVALDGLFPSLATRACKLKVGGLDTQVI